MPDAYVIPTDVFRALDGWALKAYVLIANSAHPLSCATIAAELGISERTARRTVVELREKGFLQERTNLATADKSGQKRTNLTATDKSVKENFPQTPIKENFPLPPEKNAPAHPHEDLISWITDDEAMRPYAEEFVRGLRARGEDPEKKGAAELRRHFGFWLPKYQAKREIAAKRLLGVVVQNEAKDAREAESKNLQRQLDEQRWAAETEEAKAERERVLAKFGRSPSPTP